ncbi:hypothetical protein [Dysgonomonas sp. BGC7]|uniref:hypothetical protein n=1 Tax=Dysgonomonas sp. BGC7 TaxID=1658008 RepID=UPI000681FFB6|nr:hypothetical protein [Dysgonomonas sp. BGC7]MBD8389646.1 hypothetical protein [Dysgonomonas sp. BGC7]
MRKIYDSSMKISKPWSNIYDRETREGKLYCAGLYTCKYGFVKCTSEYDNNRSYLRFAYNGVLYMRTIQKSYSPRGLAIMAGKFVNEIINPELLTSK